MAYNADLTRRVRNALAHIPRVEEKKMFRGVTFMVDHKMCVSVGNEELMVRIDPSLHDLVTAKPGCRSMIMKDKVYRGYVYVHENNIRTQAALAYWIDLALEWNKHAKGSKKRK